MNQLAKIENTEVVAQPVTPMQMLQMAVQQGADLDKLQKLMDLQERWEKSEARKAYVTAMAAFKKNPPVVIKDKSVSFGAGKTSYKHAALDNASEQIGHALSEHGISHSWGVQQIDGGIIKVTCTLTHQLGHSESVTLQATPDTSGSKNSIQAIGSTVSYLQRYSLFSATGLAPKDVDDDGNGGNGAGMPASQKTDFENAIDALTDMTQAAELWKKISNACVQHKDVETNNELRSLLNQKNAELKGKK